MTVSVFDRLRLLAAFQVLAMPEGVLGARHEDARTVVSDLTGVAYDAGREARPEGAADLATWLSWHLGGES